MAKDKEKPVAKKTASRYEITKANGNMITRDALTDAEIKMYESKGCKVEAK